MTTSACTLVPNDNQALHEELVAAAAHLPEKPAPTIHEFIVRPNH